MAEVIIATLPTIAGARITRSLGVVLAEGSTQRTVEELQKRAGEMGANAVVGVRWVARDPDTLMFVSGTAVVTEPEAS